MYSIKYRETFFKTNSEVHGCNARFNYDLHFSIVNFSIFHKGVSCSCAKHFNHLPLALKQLTNDISKFIVDLKRFLLINSLYALEEYYSWK
jgi:SPX domain protein involved in polyphosphate accumulation